MSFLRFSNNDKPRLKSETKSLHDEKAPTLKLTVEKSEKSELLERAGVLLCILESNSNSLCTLKSCENTLKTSGYSMWR